MSYRERKFLMLEEKIFDREHANKKNEKFGFHMKYIWSIMEWNLCYICSYITTLQ